MDLSYLWILFFLSKKYSVNKAKNTQKCPKKFPYLRPTNFNYDLETTSITGKKNPESLLMKQLKRHVFTSTASRRCTSFCHQKQWPPGITLTESQTNVNLTKTDVYRGAKSAPGVRGRSAREKDRYTRGQVSREIWISLIQFTVKACESYWACYV